MSEVATDRRAGSAERRYFLGGTAGLFLLRVFSVGLGLAVSTILARELGASEFGVFSVAIGVATLLALPFSGGVPTLLMAEISKARELDDGETLSGVIRWGYYVQVILVVAVIALAVLVYGVASAGGWWWWDARETMIAALVLCIVPVMGFINLQRGILVGFERPVLSGLGEQIFRPLAMMALLLLLIGMLERGSIVALQAQLAASIIAALIGMAMILRVMPRAPANRPVIRWKEWTLAVLPLTATSATTIVNNNTDIIMLGMLQPPEEAGVYRIAAQISVLAAVLMQILRSLAAPKISAAHAREDRVTMRYLMVQTGRATTAAAFAFVLAFAIFGEFALVFVFGPEYAAAYWPCLVLAAGTVFSASCGLVGVALQMTRNAGIVAKSAIWAALVNVVLNLALVPTYGALGAAIGTSLSLFAMQVQLWWKARSRLGIRTDIFQAARA